ncbi:NAD-dependent succinate-semialdehyde dehydrogenase [[Bacillus] sp. KCTC 13219]|nr:NAD-dependent succinate-semialdehyde dehydrogenase [[Bacillus] sp. KCTC 13219]
MEKYMLYIDGQWMEPVSGNYENIISPATGKIISQVAVGDERDAQKAIDASVHAFKDWSARTAGERANILRKFAQLLEQNRQQLSQAVSAESGKPLKEADIEVTRSIDYALWNAEEGRRIYGETIPAPSRNKRIEVIHQPVGPIAAITPWNFPLSMIVRKITPALAAGCTVVLKPAPTTPGSAVLVCQLAEQAGIPAGVVNLVLGDAEKIGKALLTDKLIRKITFTGSTKVGKLLLKQAADQVKRVSMELGGHAPLIIFEDADLEQAATNVAQIKFYNSGQTCICPNRIYVQQTIVEPFIQLLKKKVEALKIGNGLQPEVEMGPLVNHQAVEKVHAQVNDAIHKGATLITGGTIPTIEGCENGSFYAPTILANINHHMTIAHEETFGPVAAIATFESEEEVLAHANNTDYGLAAYVFTKDLARSIRVSEELEYGMVGINDTAVTVVEGPFGGIKESGMGREGGPGSLHDFLNKKLITTTI